MSTKRPMGCEARQFSDQMRCERCDLTWDMNDPEPPECRDGSEPTEAEMSAFRARFAETMERPEARVVSEVTRPAPGQVELPISSLKGKLLEVIFQQCLEKFEPGCGVVLRPNGSGWDQLGIEVRRRKYYGPDTRTWVATRHGVISSPGSSVMQAAMRCYVRSLLGPRVRIGVSI